MIETTGARFGVNLISAVSANGAFRFMTIEGKMDSSKFIEFLKRLQHGSTQKIFLIVDGHPVHKSKAVKAYVAEVKRQMKRLQKLRHIIRGFFGAPNLTYMKMSDN